MPNYMCRQDPAESSLPHIVTDNCRVRLRHTHKYQTQMQMQMAVTKSALFLSSVSVATFWKEYGKTNHSGTFASPCWRQLSIFLFRPAWWHLCYHLIPRITH